MLKKLCKIVLPVMAAVMMIFSLTACDGGLIDKAIEDSLSEVRTQVFEGTGEFDTVATVYTGRRETNYKIDGVASGMSNYTVLSVTPQSVSADVQFTFVLKYDGTEAMGSMTVHPFGTSYTAEIDAEIHSEEAIELIVTRTDSEVSVNIILNPSRAGDMMTWDAAVNRAAEVLAEDIADMYDGKQFKAETYVKFICEPNGGEDAHYWYVAFINGEKTVAVLMEPVSGEILARRNA